MSYVPASGRFGRRRRGLRPADAWVERLQILLSTRPGQLPWRPTFGVDLEWLVGQPLNGVNLSLLEWRVKSAVTEWLPQLTVRELSVNVVSDYQRARNQRDRAVPIAESALLPYGAGGIVEIQLDVVSPEGPLDFGMTLGAKP